MANARIEGVESKVEFLTQDARKLAFEDEHFDVVFSLLCLHNIPSKAAQADYVPTHAYAATLRDCGLQVSGSATQFIRAHGLMWALTAEK